MILLGAGGAREEAAVSVVSLLDRAYWSGVAAEGEGTVDGGVAAATAAGVRLMALMVSKFGTEDNELLWRRRCGLLKAVNQRGLVTVVCDRWLWSALM